MLLLACYFQIRISFQFEFNAKVTFTEQQESNIAYIRLYNLRMQSLASNTYITANALELRKVVGCLGHGQHLQGWSVKYSSVKKQKFLIYNLVNSKQ